MSRITGLFIMLCALCILKPHLKAGPVGISSYAVSARSTGKAGTGVSGTGSVYSFLNPAALSSIERYMLTVNYGSLDSDFYYPVGSLFIPTSWGVFGISFSRLDVADDESETVNSVSFAMGKNITDNLSFGIGVDGALSSLDSYFGIRTGVRYSLPLSSGRRGFVILNPAIGISGSAGYSENGDLDYTSVTAGYSFIFYRQDDLTVALDNDISWFRGGEIVPVKIGLEFGLGRFFDLRTGIVLPQGDDYISYTGGFSAGYKGERGGISFDYSLSYSKKRHVDHYVGLTVEYGSLDRDGPLTRINTDRSFISPNEDGIQDYMVFSTEVRDQSPVKGWKLEIVNGSGETVKKFHISDRDIDEGMSPSIFIRRVFSTRESIVVPEKIMWDGKDSRGEKVPDGKYSYHFFAWDLRDNIAPVRSGFIFVDTKGPSVELAEKRAIFSPNGDGNRDILKIRQKVDTAPEDQWTGAVKDETGKVVKTWVWAGTDVPDYMVWDGKNDSGKELADGLYSYEIQCTDKAGNRTSAVMKEIVLVRAMETVDVTASEEFVSYGKINDSKPVRFFTEVSGREGIEKWEFVIYEGKDKPVRTIAGSGDVPPVISWNGLDEKNRKLDDGEYGYRLRVWYASGNNPGSFLKRLPVDSTAPELTLKHDPSLFSPDDDGENDYLNIYMSGRDKFGIEKWELKIISENGVLFKTFTGKGSPPSMLKWDGVGDNRELVESASDYIMEFTAVDFSGNKTDTVSDRLSVDVLVVVTERGLKMRISNIEFPFGSSRIRKRGIGILDRVYSILEKYGSYNVVIEGHTDDVGKETYNIKLSEARALSVKKYLEYKGTATSRLTYRGLGESMPFYPNTSEENRRRNRRVEFILVKGKGDDENQQDVESTRKLKGESL